MLIPSLVSNTGTNCLHFCGPRNETELLAGFNDLSGTIPSTFGALRELVELYLQINKLSGEVPSELGQLTKLGELILILQ